jgi:thiol-disulfide isomerase/thioredoxin
VRPPRRSVALLLGAVALAACGKAPTFARDLDAAAPPPLRTDGVTWLNVDAPLSFASLKGKVVYVEFGFEGCPHCRAMEPRLAQWHERWADKGLVVLGIEDGTSTPLQAWRDLVEREKIAHPVLHDGLGANVALYQVRGFPSAYLVGRAGKVLWQGVPMRDLSGLEAAIKSAVEG